MSRGLWNTAAIILKSEDMPQKLLYNFPIHAFIIFKGTTKNRIATAIIYSAAILFPCYRACVYFKSVVRLWYLQKG